MCVCMSVCASFFTLSGLHRVTLHCHDDSARFIRMLAGVGKNYLTEEDFEVLVQVGIWQGRELSFGKGGGGFVKGKCTPMLKSIE